MCRAYALSKRQVNVGKTSAPSARGAAGAGCYPQGKDDARKSHRAIADETRREADAGVAQCGGIGDGEAGERYDQKTCGP